MYIPASFRIEDPDQLATFIEQHSFATLVTHDGRAPFATHLPVLLDRTRGPLGTLCGHLALANPQWRHFTPEAEALLLFQGPHAYVSPAWYEIQPAVPTWNYTAVHAYGVPERLSDAARIRKTLDLLVARHEADLPQPWDGNLPDAYRHRMLEGIVAFEMPLTRIEGKFKLGQNRSPADYARVIESLRSSPQAGDRELAALMIRERPNNLGHSDRT
jgi:transcriptional regulator